MITPEQHLARILTSVGPLPSDSVDLRVGAVGLSALVGRTLAADVVAAVPLPGFTNSAMDGYAVRAADVAEVGVRLPVLGDIPAGDTRRLTLAPGRVWRIMTGAAVPEGADSVVPVEQTDAGAETVTVDEPPRLGQHLRHVGEDVAVGDVVLPAGTVLAPHHVAVLASAGVARADLRPRPRVAVISTGDELLPAGSPVQHGQIHDSNGPMLAALVAAAGASLFEVRHLPDDEAAVERALAEITGPDGADVVITTGGVSAGAFDVVKGALLEAGDVTFERVAMQPGKPQGFGLLGERRVPVFTLPGNPMSTLVSFHVFVAPALAVLAGRPVRRRRRGVVEAGWRATSGRMQFARVELRTDDAGRLFITPNQRQGSHHLGELARATALAVVPVEVEDVRPGIELDVIDLLEG